MLYKYGECTKTLNSEFSLEIYILGSPETPKSGISNVPVYVRGQLQRPNHYPYSDQIDSSKHTFFFQNIDSRNNFENPFLMFYK